MLLLQRLLEASDTLLMRMLPFIVLLVVPSLALMSDALRSVRRSASWAFGRLIAVLPLAQDAEPAGLGPALEQRRAGDECFLKQLLDSRQVQPYEPTAVPSVSLRSYQQEGVAWLAFLLRFGLHGVLADDMGLGKTLQALCIIASATKEASLCKDSTTGRDASKPLSSLIICPATLVRSVLLVLFCCILLMSAPYHR